MPVTTFLNELEKKSFTRVTDSELNELFQEVRAIENRFLLQERIIFRKRWFRKSIIETRYTLYFDYLAPESNWDIQIIGLSEGNIYGDLNNKELICAYFYGFLSRRVK